MDNPCTLFIKSTISYFSSSNAGSLGRIALVSMRCVWAWERLYLVNYDHFVFGPQGMELWRLALEDVLVRT